MGIMALQIEQHGLLKPAAITYLNPCCSSNSPQIDRLEFARTFGTRCAMTLHC
jgi:hypothetical protein